jgi:hypothetical protein
MDRSKDFSYNNFDNNLEILLAKYYLPLWSPKSLTVDNGTEFSFEAL